MIAASITIANALPGIVPTLRDYDMGQWPQGKMKMRNGRVQRWGLSSIPTGDKMRLVWENITYAQAESLCIVWDRNYGIYGQVLLPPETLAGTSGGLTALMATPFAGATWQFTGPPQVKPVKARRCTVEMPIGVRGFVRQDLSVGDGTQSVYDGCNTCADDDDCTLDGGGGGTSILKCWYQRGPSGSTRAKVYGCVVDPNGDMYVAQYTGAGVLPSIYKISNDLTQVWGKLYSLDPAFVSSAFNAYGSSYFLLNSGATHIEFLAWQWSPAGPPYDRGYPIRIYRYRISKTDGSIINVAAVDFAPTGNPSELYIDIRDVKIDASNNYYFIGSLPIGTESLTPAVFKFTQNLAFVWCKAIPRTVYRGSTKCAVTMHDGNLPASLTISDGGLIGCTGSGSFVYVTPHYFSLDFNGNTLSSFSSKFQTSDFENDINPFIPRSVCRDAAGNVYGMGNYSASLAMGEFSDPIIVYKDSPTDTTIWAKNIRNTFFPGRGNLIGAGNQLLVISNKLILVAPWRLGGSYELLICIFNTTTGAIERSLDFRAPQTFGERAMIQPLPESGKFIVQTDAGYRIRLDVNDLPPTGSYPCTDSSAAYTVSDASTATVDHTFYRFRDCGSSSPALIDRNLSGMFASVTPVSTITTATGGSFADFTCQDD